METLTPKQRELRERESRILELARPIIAGGGMAALSMEAIASELKLARGTVYNHFPNKEEIILALAIQAVEQRLAIFNEAVTMRGTPRERVAAIGIGCEIFADHFPELFRVEYIIRHDLVWEKTSSRRQSLLRSCEGRCMHTVAGVVRDAIANGDLQFTAHGPAKVSARRSQLETASQHDVSSQIEDIVFGLWSLVYGSLLLEMTSPSLADIGIVDSRRAIRRNCNALLDGLGWQPLYCPDAYAKWAAHVSQTLVTRFVTLESP